MHGATKAITNAPAAKYKWKRKYQQILDKDKNVMTIMNLVRESKKKGFNENEIRKQETVLFGKWIKKWGT